MRDEPDSAAVRSYSGQPLMKPLTAANLRLNQAAPLEKEKAEVTAEPVYTPNEEPASSRRRRHHRSRLVEKESFTSEAAFPSAVLPTNESAEFKAAPPSGPEGLPQKIYAIPYYIQQDQKAYKQGTPVYLPVSELGNGQPINADAAVPAMPAMLFMAGNDDFSAFREENTPIGQIVAPAGSSATGKESSAFQADDDVKPSRSIAAGEASAAVPSVHPSAGKDADDGDIDENTADAVPSEKMADPVPISFMEMQTGAHKRRIWPWIAALCVVLAGVGAFIVWQNTHPSADSSRSAVEANAVSSGEPANSKNMIQGFSVEKTSGSIPIDVVFTAVTSSDIASLSLIDDSGKVISAAATFEQSGDLINWYLIARFEKPYSGVIHAYYSDTDGYLVDSGSGVHVNFF